MLELILPRWLALALLGPALLGVAACTATIADAPAPTLAAMPPVEETYVARGQAPLWMLRIEDGSIHYIGGYGEVRVSEQRSDPQPTPTGRRYRTERIIVEVAYRRCNEATSGHGYEHRVAVTVGDSNVHGCGGARRPGWDR